jgi:ATPase subunit of ABC transporter with duplicated ATPase domains
MIAVDNLSKSFGAQLLFDGISFKVNRKERVGLVGRNGHGKTTLFRIIAGLESADSGTVSIPRNYRIGYLEQEPVFTAETVLQEAALGLPPAERDKMWKAEKILSASASTQRFECPHQPGVTRSNLAKAFTGMLRFLTNQQLLTSPPSLAGPLLKSWRAVVNYPTGASWTR